MLFKATFSLLVVLGLLCSLGEAFQSTPRSSSYASIQNTASLSKSAFSLSPLYYEIPKKGEKREIGRLIKNIIFPGIYTDYADTKATIKEKKISTNIETDEARFAKARLVTFHLEPNNPNNPDKPII